MTTEAMLMVNARVATPRWIVRRTAGANDPTPVVTRAAPAARGLRLLPRTASSLSRLHTDGERGQALILATLWMVVVLGCAALVIDFGQLAVTKRKLQNGADAAALAGAWQLPNAPAAAQADAAAWATKNEVVGGEVTEAVVLTTSLANDTMRVTVSRPVQYTFAQVLGMTSKTVTSTATARQFTLNGIDTTNPRAFPYMVWGGNVPRNLTEGVRVIYRSNKYRDQVTPIAGCTNAPRNNCNWNIGSNTFKGFFHWQAGTLYISPVQQAFSQGGNATDAQPTARLVAYQQAGVPVIMPVVGFASDLNNALQFTIIGFVCVRLDPIDTTNEKDWTGVITKCSAPGRRDGLTAPSPGITNAFVTALVN